MRLLLVSVRVTVVAATLLLALSACGPAYRGEPLYGPLQSVTPEIARGERVFHVHCHQCHPGGAGGVGFAINNKPLPRSLIAFQVRNGVGAMPAFGTDEISDPELEDLTTYLVALRSLQ